MPVLEGRFASETAVEALRTEVPVRGLPVVDEVVRVVGAAVLLVVVLVVDEEVVGLAAWCVQPAKIRPARPSGTMSLLVIFFMVNPRFGRFGLQMATRTVPYGGTSSEPGKACGPPR